MIRRFHGGYRTHKASETPVLAVGLRFLAACAFHCAVAVAPFKSIGRGKPRVFVYDLPVYIADGIPTRDDRQCDGLVSGSPDLLDCLFGAEFTVRTEIGPLTLRKTDQYAMGRIFLWRIMGSVSRVAHPDEADLFFVPFWYSDAFPTPTTCPTATEIMAHLHHLDAITVGKHIFVSPRVAHNGDVCPFWWGHPWHRGLPKGAVDYNAPVHEKLAAGHMNSVMKFALEDRDCCWWAVGENTHSIPYPGFGSGLDLNMTRKLRKLREPNRSRPILAMGAFGIHGDHKEHSKSLRAELAKECKAHGLPICSGVVLKVIQKSGHTLGLSDGTFTELVTTMLRSRFCFQPTGDTPSRKGIIDSILLGCIPVLFSVNQTRLWPWNLPDLSNASVLLDVAKGSVVDQLKQIDEDRVTQLRSGVAEAAESLAYAIQDGTGDAVEAALYHAWIHTGGRPEEQHLTPGPTVWSSSTQPARKEHHGLLAFGHEAAEEKTPQQRPRWSDTWIGILICAFSIVIGVSISVMVLRSCPKQPGSARGRDKPPFATPAKEDHNKLLGSDGQNS